MDQERKSPRGRKAPPEQPYLAKPQPWRKHESSDARRARRVSELENQQADLKREAAERRDRQDAPGG
jgi:hypothetical protein